MMPRQHRSRQIVKRGSGGLGQQERANRLGTAGARPRVSIRLHPGSGRRV